MPNVAPQPRDRIVRALTRTYDCTLAREGSRHTIYVKVGIPEAIVLLRHPRSLPASSGTFAKSSACLSVTFWRH